MLSHKLKIIFSIQRILAGIDDIQGYLDDHLLKTQAMRGSPYFKAFESKLYFMLGGKVWTLLCAGYRIRYT